MVPSVRPLAGPPSSSVSFVSHAWRHRKHPRTGQTAAILSVEQTRTVQSTRMETTMSPSTQSLPASAAEVRVSHAMPQPAPNTDGIWYASYAPGVPHEIDVAQFASIVQLFDECTQK